MNLIDLFYNIEPSKSEKDGKYIVEKIQIKKEHYIAKSLTNKPVILFKVKDNNVISERINLLELWRVNDTNTYETIGKNNQITKDQYTVLEFFSDNVNEQSAFLKIINQIIDDLESITSNKTLSKYLFTLKSIFIEKKNNTKGLQGLWSELFVIDNTSNTLEALTSYQSEKARDIWDFYSLDKAVEIKSSKNNSRIHRFKYQQLHSESDKIFIVSIIAKKVIDGCSLEELINKIKEKIDDKYLIFKLDTIVDMIIEKTDVTKTKFDYQTAQKSLLIYENVDVPRITEAKEGIHNIEYSVDMSHARPSPITLDDLF